MNQEFQIIDEEDFREIYNLKNKNIELNKLIKSNEQQNIELHKIIELMKNKIESLELELESNKNLIEPFTIKTNDIESNIDDTNSPCIQTKTKTNINVIELNSNNQNYIGDCLILNLKLLFECCCSNFYKTNKNNGI